MRSSRQIIFNFGSKKNFFIYQPLALSHSHTPMHTHSPPLGHRSKTTGKKHTSNCHLNDFSIPSLPSLSISAIWEFILFFPRPLFLFVFSLQLTRNVQHNFLPMTGFELRASGFGIDHSTNWATTTSLHLIISSLICFQLRIFFRG